MAAKSKSVVGTVSATRTPKKKNPSHYVIELEPGLSRTAGGRDTPVKGYKEKVPVRQVQAIPGFGV